MTAPFVAQIKIMYARFNLLVNRERNQFAALVLVSRHRDFVSVAQPTVAENHGAL
jgi:hypothetical protein